MTSPDQRDITRKQIQYDLAKVLEQLLLVDEATHPTGANPGSPAISLWDIFVPLRSSLHLDVHIEDGTLAEVRLCLPEYCIAAYRPSAVDLETLQGNRPSAVECTIRSEFLEVLFEQCVEMIRGSADTILRLSPRLLISAPYWEDGLRERFAGVDVPSALNCFDRMVLLGGPGSGKSTVLKAVAAALLEQHVSGGSGENLSRIGLWPKSSVLPVFVRLQDFIRSEFFPNIKSPARADHLLAFIQNSIFADSEATRSYFQEKLQDGNILFLLDGLDEVPIPTNIPDALEHRREQMQQLMQSLGARFPRCRVVVSSRPAGYSGWTLQGFDAVRILPLNEDESIDLAKALYVGLGSASSKALEQAKRFVDDISGVPQSLRSQPLFLVLLALLYNQRENEALPRKRGELLHATIEFLIQSWSVRRTEKNTLTELLGCDERALFRRLSLIAFRSMKELPRNLEGETNIPRALLLDELLELGSHVNPSLVLEYVSQHAGILVSPAPRTYNFAHRLFQEYLSAFWLSDRNDSDTDIDSLLRSDPVTWREVVLLICDIFYERRAPEKIWLMVDLLVRLGDPEQLWLAARVLLDQNISARNGSPFVSVSDTLKSRIIEVLDVDILLSSVQRSDLVDALAVVGDSRRGVSVVDGLPDVCWLRFPQCEAQIGTSDGEIDEIQRLGAGGWDFSREQPSHVVSIDEFELAKYPVTIAQYQRFVEAPDGFCDDRWWSSAGRRWRDSEGPAPVPRGSFVNHPQGYVTWFEAVAFCRWLSAVTEWTVRLPTEVEWEWAARGPSSSLFPWGSEANRVLANTREAGIGRICGVGCFVETPRVWSSGVPTDLIGNVWEWCSTIVEDGAREFRYPYDATDGREGIDDGADVLRATRGGYYGNPLFVARASYRGRDRPAARLARQGFRLARDNERR